MRSMNQFAVAATIALGVLAGFSGPVRAQVTAFEGARLIVGDGRAPIENATIVVNGTRIAQAGPAASVTVPAGAARGNLPGKTGMAMNPHTHVHLRPTRGGLIKELKKRA